MAEPLDLTHYTVNDLHPITGVGVPPENEGFVNNLKRSATKFATDIGSTITHPLDTANSIFDLSVGYLNKLNPKGATHADAPRQTAMADAMTEHLKQRYGSLEAIKKTAYEDPVGFAADLSTVLDGVGIAGNVAAKASQLAGLGKTASTVAKVADVAKAAGTVTNPLRAGKTAVQVPAELAAKGAKAVGMERTANLANTIAHPIQAMENPAVNLYRSVFKPAGTVAEGDAKARTMLQEGIAPNDEAKAWAKIHGYSDQAKAMMDDPRAAGLGVDPQKVIDSEYVKALTRPAEEGGKPGVSFETQVTPGDDPTKVQGIIDEFKRRYFSPAIPAKPGAIKQVGEDIVVSGPQAAIPPQPKPIPLRAVTSTGETVYPAQDIKSGTYQMISNKQKGGGPMASQPLPHAEQQTQYALARGIREQIGNELEGVGISGIHDINKAEGNILSAMPDIQRNATASANAGFTTNLKDLAMKSLPAHVAMGMYKAGKISLPTLLDHLRSTGAIGGRMNDAGVGQ